MSADPASPVAVLRSLLMQALHPLAMAGVDQHSGWRRDPVAGYIAVPRPYVILQRINLGLFAVLGELSAHRRLARYLRGDMALHPRPDRHPDGTSRGRMADAAPGDGGMTGLRPAPGCRAELAG